MSKNEKFKTHQSWKPGKSLAILGAALVVLAGGGSVIVHSNASTTGKTILKSTFPDPPNSTHVNYKNNSPILHIVLEDGTEDALTYLYLDDNTPVF